MQLKLPSIPSHVLQPANLEVLYHHLSGMRFGVEKEGLRVNAKTGELAQTPHPNALGSALTHPHITTDYSEALLEFVTGTHSSPQAAISQLEQLQTFASSVLENERIWPLSMPCVLPESDADIPLAYYGESHIGRLKTVYRRGLGFRYGRQMQTIAECTLIYPLAMIFGDGKQAWVRIRVSLTSVPFVIPVTSGRFVTSGEFSG